MSLPDTVIEDLASVEVIEVPAIAVASQVVFTPTSDFDSAPATVQAALAELAQRIKALEP